jgi:hypothetical protein
VLAKNLKELKVMEKTQILYLDNEKVSIAKMRVEDLSKKIDDTTNEYYFSVM